MPSPAAKLTEVASKSYPCQKVSLNGMLHHGFPVPISITFQIIMEIFGAEHQLAQSEATSSNQHHIW